MGIVFGIRTFGAFSLTPWPYAHSGMHVVVKRFLPLATGDPTSLLYYQFADLKQQKLLGSRTES